MKEASNSSTLLVASIHSDLFTYNIHIPNQWIETCQFTLTFRVKPTSVHALSCSKYFLDMHLEFLFPIQMCKGGT